MNNLTAILISFLRPEYTKECIKSLRRMYPDIHILVGDNAGHNEDLESCAWEYGARYFSLPFDSGVCFARNRLMELVRTDYVLVGDDDFYYTETAKVPEMLKLLENNRALSLIGGRVFEGGKVKNYQGTIDIYPDHFVYHKIDETKNLIDKASGLHYQECDITFNYFVACTKDILPIQWDENIKVAFEHSDWFISLKKAGLKVAYTPDAVVVHKPEHVKVARELEYRGYRTRRSDKDYFFKKHNLRYSIGLNGVRTNFNLTDEEMRNIRGHIKKPEAKADYCICITTMNRKSSLETLLKSIFARYQDVPVYIADQSDSFDIEWYKRVWSELDYLVKPVAYQIKPDSGLSAARNYLVDKSKEPVMIFMEDDFVLNKDSNLKRLVHLVNMRDDVSLAGGGIIQNDLLLHFEFRFKRLGETIYHVPDGDHWQRENGINYKETGCVFNFFAVKRKLFNDVRWDENIKINGEHNDFFYRISKTDHKVVYTADVTIDHEKNLSDLDYRQKRSRQFMDLMLKKHRAKQLTYLSGFTYKLTDDGKVCTTRVVPYSLINKK